MLGTAILAVVTAVSAIVTSVAGVHQRAVPTDVMNQQVTVNVTVKPRQVRTVPSATQELLERLAVPTWPSSVGGFLYRQRYFLASGVALGGYVLICRECVRANHYVACDESWASWHNDYSLESLLAMPQQELAKDLVIEIQRRYSNYQNPTDFIGPLISFSKAIDYEINLATRYLRLYSVLIRSHLYTLFPLHIEKCAELNSIVQRLKHIKNVFLTWAADYKVEHNRSRSLVTL